MPCYRSRYCTSSSPHLPIWAFLSVGLSVALRRVARIHPSVFVQGTGESLYPQQRNTATDSHGLGTDYRCWNQRKIDRAILPTGTLRVQHGHPPRLARTGQEPFNRVSPARAVQTSIFFNGLL
jgi:hypothetical protein